MKQQAKPTSASELLESFIKYNIVGQLAFFFHKNQQLKSQLDSLKSRIAALEANGG